MKRLGTWLLAAVMAIGLLCTMAPKTAVAVELRNAADAKLAEQKKGLVDLNNASVRRFQQFTHPGGQNCCGRPLSRALMPCWTWTWT